MGKRLSQLENIFAEYHAIKLVYLFGSRAGGKVGPLSDYDFAFYFDQPNKKKRFDLKYNIIKEGRLLYEKEPFKVMIEPKILNEYFDFRDSLLRYHLTSSKA